MEYKTDIQHPPTESDRHRILANERRRVLIDVLVDCDPPVRLGELAADVRKIENRREATTTLETLQVVLHHQHLPMLSKYGLIRYDAREMLVTETDAELQTLV